MIPFTVGTAFLMALAIFQHTMQLWESDYMFEQGTNLTCTPLAG
jgi:hypothetical protein